MQLNLLVEGFVDEAVAHRLLRACGHEPGTTFGKKGCNYIQKKAKAFDLACGSTALLTLVDFMDTRLDCPGAVVRAWLPNGHPSHVFRVVVREIESWILADREAIASFLGIPMAKVPSQPELIPDPKLALINLARLSKRPAIRSALVPPLGYASSEGPLYSSEIARFVGEHWSPERARSQAPSLEKCLLRLAQLHGMGEG